MSKNAMLFLGTIVCLSSFAFAKQPSTRTPAQSSKSSKKQSLYSKETLRKKLDELLAEADYANGDAGTLGVKFNTGKWTKDDYVAADRRVTEEWPSECGKPNPVSSRKKIIASVGSEAAGADSVTADRLTKLWTRGNLIAATAAEWDGTGESEACSHYRYHFYFNDGTSIYLHYEFTD